MREIKFRAWDKEDKKMSSNWCALNILKAIDEGRNKDIKVLMQYTGLKDKNGKEIYEGDILKGDWSIVDDIEVGEVEFYGGVFRFKPAGQPLSYGYYLKECEIIGNIYENKELLI